MSRLLVITDRCDSAWLDRALARPTGEAEWEILLLGLSQETYLRGQQSKLGQLGQWCFVDLNRIADAAQEKVRQFFPEFVFQLSRQTLGTHETLLELLNTADANLWWFLELSEKSPLRGSLVNHLHFLALIRAVLASSSYDEVWLSLEDKLLTGTVLREHRLLPPVTFIEWPSVPLRQRLREWMILRYLFNLGRNLLLHVLRCIVLSLARIGGPPPEPGGVLFFSFYPAWWNRPFQLEAVEWFFGALPDEVNRRVPTRFAVWLTLSPWDLWRYRCQIAEVFRQHRMVVLQTLVGIRRSLFLLSPGCFAKVLRFRYQHARLVRASFEGFDIAPLVVRDLNLSLSSTELFVDLLIQRAFARLTEETPTKAVVYRLEFQPFEKAILYGIRGRSFGIAFQHSTFGRNYLPYFFAPQEITRYRAHKNARASMPLPDLVLTTGKYGFDVMLNNGFARDFLEVCGPVRYMTLLEYQRKQISKVVLRQRLNLPLAKKVFFVATSVVREDSEALLVSLARAVRGLGECYVVLKIHPATPLDEDIVRQLMIEIGEPNGHLLPPEAGMYDYIAASDAVILAGSTVGVEAIVLGVVPIVFESLVVFSAKSMSEFGDACLAVRDSHELKTAIQWVLEDNYRVAESRHHSPGIIEDMFHGLDGNPYEVFVQALERHGVVSRIEML